MGVDTNKICYGCFSKIEGTGACPKCGFDPVTAKHPAIALPIGTTLNNRYLTGRVLGVGGFGVTYLALDMTLETTVAVKEYLPSGIAIREADHHTMTVSSQDEQPRFDHGANKFLEESRILAKLRSITNIVTVYDYFRENGTAYFVMEYIEGVDLLRYTASKGGRLTFEEARDLLLPIIRSLKYVHDNNLLHRDISPDNIIISKTGAAQLVDFGAARLAEDAEKSKSVILKHGFAPEEQYSRRGNQGPWSDEYAMAATMYMVITGVLPPDAFDRAYDDTLKSPLQLGLPIPQYGNDAIMKALSVHAADRYPDMGAFADAISGKNAVAPAVPVVPAAPAQAYSGKPAQAAHVAPVAPVAPAAPNQVARTVATRPVASAQGQSAPVTPGQAAPAQRQAAPVQRQAAPVAPAAPRQAAPVQRQAAPVRQQAAQVSPSPRQAVPAASVVPSYMPSTTMPQKKSIWKKPLTYVILSIIVIAAIAVPVIYFATKGGNTESTTKKTKTTTTEDTEEYTLEDFYTASQIKQMNDQLYDAYVKNNSQYKNVKIDIKGNTIYYKYWFNFELSDDMIASLEASEGELQSQIPDVKDQIKSETGIKPKKVVYIFYDVYDDEVFRAEG